jgi:ATP-dependent DNA ligase
VAEYIVHKAVELSKVKAKRRAVLEQPGFLEANYIAQPKYDGCNLIIEVHEDLGGERWTYAYSRTGEEVKSVGHIELALMTLPDLPYGVYLGEAWCPDASFAEISGWFRRQNADEHTCRLQMAVFDALTLDEWNNGYSDVPYEARADRIAPLTHVKQGANPVWSAGSFGRIADTWNNTTAQDVCNKLVEAGGYDGLILRDPQGVWRKGDRGTGGEIIKIKRKLSFDLRVIGREEGKGKHRGRLGAIIVEFNGNELRVGTGFTDAERSAWWGGTEPIGKIVEIEAMDYSSDGLLREPRFKGVRFDKTEPDA